MSVFPEISPMFGDTFALKNDAPVILVSVFWPNSFWQTPHATRLIWRCENALPALSFEQCQVVVFIADDLEFLGPGVQTS